MKYLNGSVGNEYMKYILDEAFNLESGKVYYEKGKLVGDNKSPAYPTFTLDGIKTIIRPNMGLIFMPYSMIDNFIRPFINGLSGMTEEFVKKFKFDPLQTYSPLETGSDHFTILKVKHSLDTTTSSKYAYDIFKRRIYHNENGDKLEKVIGNGRFTWVIYSLEQLIDDISNFLNRKIPIECQLVSIIYDPDNILNYQNNTVQISNVTFKNFKSCKNLLTISAFGEINGEFINKNAESTNPLIKDLVDQYKNYSDRPEYHAGWYQNSSSIILCEKRRGAFELIRHYGNFSMFLGNMYLPICVVTQAVYEVEYSDIVIDNSPYSKSNHICFNCDTPLYDDIYVIFRNKNVNIGSACCAVCLHSRFNEEKKADHTGQYLYNNQNVLGRTKYPKSVEQLILAIDTDDVVKEILIQSFKNLYAEEYGLGKLMLLNFPNTSSKKKFVGWSQVLGLYVNHVNDYSSTIYNKFNSKSDAKKYLENAYIFPYLHMTYK
jgi:hypothetical protein